MFLIFFLLSVFALPLALIFTCSHKKNTSPPHQQLSQPQIQQSYSQPQMQPQPQQIMQPQQQQIQQPPGPPMAYGQQPQLLPPPPGYNPYVHKQSQEVGSMRVLCLIDVFGKYIVLLRAYL